LGGSVELVFLVRFSGSKISKVDVVLKSHFKTVFDETVLFTKYSKNFIAASVIFLLLKTSVSVVVFAGHVEHEFGADRRTGHLSHFGQLDFPFDRLFFDVVDI
jgi:hypothetical protein